MNKAVENWQKVWAPGNEVEEVSDNSIADWKMLNQKIQEMHAVTTPRYRCASSVLIDGGVCPPMSLCAYTLEYMHSSSGSD